MKAVINYFAELLAVLKAIELHLREIRSHTKDVSSCVGTVMHDPRRAAMRVDTRNY